MKSNILEMPVKFRASKRRSKKNIPDNVIRFPEVMTLTRRIRMNTAPMEISSHGKN